MNKTARPSTSSSQQGVCGYADVVVVGGGLAGLSLTALLANRGVAVVCIDREDPEKILHESFDGRTTAISYGSQKVLAAAGVWEEAPLQAAAINVIHILDGDSPVLLEFSSREVGDKPFGWIAENRLLRKALYSRIRALKNSSLVSPASVRDFRPGEEDITVCLDDGREIRGALVVGADGRGSFTRSWMGIDTRNWSYRQRALVCTVRHEYPHEDIAVENFHPSGPFAILPMADDEQGNHRSSVVWTEHGPDRASARHYDQASFDAALTARFPDRYGKVSQTGGRFAYPLGLIHAHNYTAQRMALVAEAAHGIHPIAGQGLNMGLRDVATLADLVSKALEEGRDPGGVNLLARYQRERRLDNMLMAGATDSLNRLFSNDLLPVRLARRTGLRMVSRMDFAKQFFMKQAMGAAGLLPSLIRDQDAAA